MRIAVLTSSYPRFPGDGTAPFIQSICEHLARLGHAIEVVAPYDPAVQPIDMEGVRVHRFRYIWPRLLHIMGHARALDADVRLKPLALLLLPLYLAAAFRKILLVTAWQRSQAIHAHWVLPNGLVAAWAAAWRGIPFVISLHGSDIFLARRNWAFGLVAGYVFRRAAAITACSPDLQQGALEVGAPADRILLLPYGADPDRFHPAQRKPETRRAYGAGPQDLLIVTVGRLVHKKGFDILLAALPGVLNKHSRARAVLGGDGPLRERLSQAAAQLGIAGRVVLPGRIPWDCVPELLAAADIFVLPSVRDASGNVDGLPNVLMEAMSCGTAAVASDIGGVSLVIEPGRNGLLVPPGDAPALADAIMALAADPGLRDRLGKAARLAVETRFNWQSFAREIANLVERAVQARELQA